MHEMEITAARSNIAHMCSQFEKKMVNFSCIIDSSSGFDVVCQHNTQY